MAKQADVELRIRSRDLSKKGIAEVTKEIDALNAKLREQRDAATIASTSVKELKNQQQALASASANLNARRGDIEAMQRQQAEIAQTVAALNKYRRELAELRTIQRSGNFLGDIDGAIKRVGQSVTTTSRLLDKQQSAFNRAADRAREYGVDVDDLAGSLKRVDALQTSLVGSLDEANAAFARRETAVKGAAAAQAKQEQATREAAAAEQKLQQELAESIRFEQEREAARRQFRVQESRAGFEEGFAAREQAEREITAEAMRRNALEREAAANGLREVIERDNAERALAARRLQAMETFANASKKQLRNPESRDAVVQEQKLLDTRRKLGPVTRDLGSANNAAESAQRRLNNQTRTALSFNQRLRGQLLSIAAAYFGIFEAINTVRKSIATDIERQGTMMRLQVAAGGDSVQAGKDFEYVREQADRLGQRLDPLAAQYSKFAIAAQGAGKSLATTRQVFEDFTEVSTVLQLSQENLDGIFKALEQSFSKGIIQAEELRGQLGDRLPGAFTKLAKAIGVSNGELTKLMENGELTADVLPLLGELLANEVASSLPEATTNVRAELARLKTAFDNFLITLSHGGLGEAVRELSVEMREFFQSDDGKQFAEDLAQSFRIAVDAVRGLISVLGGPSGVISVLKLMVAIQIARWAGLWAQGIGAAILKLTALRAATLEAGAAARTMGARFMGALGPIGVILAVITEALIYFKLKSDEASDAAERHADRLDQLRTASGQALNAQIELANQDIENKKRALAAALAKKQQALASYDAAKATLSEVSAFTLLMRVIPGADMAKASLLAGLEARAIAAGKEVETLKRQLGELSDASAGASARLATQSVAANQRVVKDVAALTSEVQDKANAARLKSDEKYYNEVFKRQNELAHQLADIPSEYVDQTTRDALDTLQATLARIKAERLGLDFSRLDKGDKEDEKARRAAEKAARERERAEQKRLDMANRTKEALLAIERDISEAQIDTQATTMEGVQANLQHRLDIIDAEIAKRLSDLEEMRRDAVKFGDAQSVANVDKAIAGTEQLRVLQKAQATQQNTYEQFQKGEELLNNLIDERAAKIELINAMREAGQLTALEAEQRAHDAVISSQDEIAAKAQALRDFLLANRDALSKMMNVDAVILKMDALSLKINEGTTASERFLFKWRDEISTGVADTFGVMAAGIADVIKGVGSWSDAFKNAADAFLSFASDFLINIGKMIMQAIILQAIQNAISGTSGGYMNAALGVLGIGKKHTGGMIGGASFGSFAQVSPLAFVGAPRYHNGGFPGLRSDEVPIIAQTGEEMLSRTDPRNALNGGAAPQAPNIKIVNAIDSDSVVSEAMSRRSGQQPVINMMRARKAEIKQILGV